MPGCRATARRGGRPRCRWSGRVAGIGAPPSALIGVRYALERGRGRRAVPVGTALLGMVMAVAALCATAVFGASLTRLITSPALYGVPFQAEFTNEGTGSGSVLTGALLASLRQDPAITRITLARWWRSTSMGGTSARSP